MCTCVFVHSKFPLVSVRREASFGTVPFNARNSGVNSKVLHICVHITFCFALIRLFISFVMHNKIDFLVHFNYVLGIFHVYTYSGVVLL